MATSNVHQDRDAAALVAKLIAQNAPAWIIQKARWGYYSDFLAEYPVSQLERDLGKPLEPPGPPQPPILDNATTLNPDDRSAGAVLSNGNLRVTFSGVTQFVRSIASHSVGKYYIEYTYHGGGGGYTCVGFASADATAASAQNTLNMIGYWGNSGPQYNVWMNGGPGINVGGGYSPGVIICAAIDLTAREVWFRKDNGLWNGSSSANPTVSGTGIALTFGAGQNIFCWISSEQQPEQWTANFGGSAYRYSVPAGYGGFPEEAPSFPATTLNPADKTPEAVLSNGNLTVTLPVTRAFVRSVDSHLTGKIYIEYTLTSGGGATAVGVATAAADATGAENTVNVVAASGNIWNNGGSFVGNVGALSAGGTICVAIDLTARRIWLRRENGPWNGNSSANPTSSETGSGLTFDSSETVFGWISAYSYTESVAQWTANFGNHPYRYPVPSGFGPFPAELLPPPLPATTLNPVDKTAGTQLTGGYLTAIFPVGNLFVRTVTSHSTGKYYIEYTHESASVGPSCAGIATAAANEGSPNNTYNTIALYIGENGRIWMNDVAVLGSGGGGAYSAGVTVGVAVDLTARQIWFRTNNNLWNGSSSADPTVTGTGFDFNFGAGQEFFGWLGAYYEGNQQFTANFGNGPYLHSVPEGYGPWVDVPTTLNPNDKTAAAMLSNGNLQVTFPANQPDPVRQFVRSVASRLTGKCYIEYTYNGGLHDAAAGFATALAAGEDVWSTANTIAAWSYGEVFMDTVGHPGDSFRSGDTVGVAVDLTARRIWFRINNGAWNRDPAADPAVDATGLNFKAVLFDGQRLLAWLSSADRDLDVQWTANFGDSAYRYPAPPDYGAFVNELPPATTLNPADRTPEVELSDGNLTATFPADPAYQYVRSIASRATGKYYIEFRHRSDWLGSFGAGIGTAAMTAEDVYLCNNLIGAYPSEGGTIYVNGNYVGGWVGENWAAGDTVCLAVDLTARQIWFRQNNGMWHRNASADPATGVGGIEFAARFAVSEAFFGFVGVWAGGVQQATVNFGNSPYRFPVPFGYGPFLPSPATTLNPADKTAEAVVSGDNLVVAFPAGAPNQFIRTVASYSAGKRYMEYTLTSGGGATAVGMATAAATAPNADDTVNTVGVYASSGNIWMNGPNNTANLGAFGAGTTIGVAVDLTARRIWFRRDTGLWNANSSADPTVSETGVALSFAAGQDLFGWICAYSGNPAQWTANFGNVPYRFPVPPGYGPF